tara:strand:- start:2481 stop:2984 length:504 start_codon:yes stop_codon:yes gene_type:complete
MIRHTKANLVGSIFVIVGLYGSIAHATSVVKEQHAFAISDIEIQLNSALNSTSNSYAQPNITFAVFNAPNLNKVRFSKVSQQPLPGIQVADFANLVPNKFKKQNSVFEFAAKFNDKLQQILAYFDFSSANSNSSNEHISEKKQDKKINFIAKNNKKQLKSLCHTSKT